MSEADFTVQDILANLPPLEQSLAELRTASQPPALAIGHCLLAFDQAKPHLRTMVAAAVDGTIANREVAMGGLLALHILGGGRDPEAWPVVLRLLRMPPDDLAALLGEAITENLPRVLPGVFNGDVESLCDLVCDARLNDFTRGSCLSALT